MKMMMSYNKNGGKDLEDENSSSTTSVTDGGNNNHSNGGWIPITIQHQNDRFSLSVSKNQTIADLKQSVIQTVKQHNPSAWNSNSYYVRLIAAGRLLAPDDAKLEDWNIQNHQILHAVIIEGGRTNQYHHRNMQSRTRRSEDESQSSSLEEENDEEEDDIYEDDSDEEEDGDDYVAYNEQDIERGAGGGRRRRNATNGNTTTYATSAGLLRNRIPLGFDRLRITAGLRRADVLAIRISFNPQLDRWLETHPEFAYLHEPDVLRRRRLQEEAWMLSQGPTSEFTLNLGGRMIHHHLAQQQQPLQRWNVPSGSTTTTTTVTPWRSNNNNNNTLNPNTAATTATNLHQLNSLSSTTVGTDRDFIWGFLLGFFVGFLMLLWVWMPTVPHKQKLGILTGYSFHLGLGMLKNKQHQYGDEDNEEYPYNDAFGGGGGGEDTTILG